MFTTVAFQQSIDPGNVYTAINVALADASIKGTTTQIFVPELTSVVGVAAQLENTVAPRARLVTPTLRVRSRFEIEPANVGAAAAVKPTSPHAFIDLRDTPLQLVKDEVLTAEIKTDPAAAQLQSVVVWLADGPIAPVAGPIFSVRFTGATALVISQWTLVPITLLEDLPRGRYQLVGLRASSAGCVAARCVGVGWRWRPGVLGVQAESHIQAPQFRYGDFGIFGEFEDTDLPQLEFLSVTADATENGIIDLIQLRSGPA